MNSKSTIYSVFIVVGISIITFCTTQKSDINLSHSVGDRIDSLDGVYVFYNGSVSNVEGRNTASDGYNLGQKYQCVEFVKRYYYEHFNHKMPDSWGHAKSFFDPNISDGKLNKTRNLIQFSMPSTSKPKKSDLIIFDGTTFNQYGHVAIISEVTDNSIEIIQQNPGRFSGSRANLDIFFEDGLWSFGNKKVLGWLRK